MPASRRLLNTLFKTPGTVLLGVLLSGLPQSPLADCRPTQPLQPMRWQQVIDGDTLRLADGRALRLVGINTPEMGRKERPAQPLAIRARDALKQALGKERLIYVQPGVEKTDRYGRLLASVFLNPEGEHVGETLLEQGLGWQVVVPPNRQYLDCLAGAEARARAASLGVWSESAYKPRAVTSLRAGEGGFMRLHGRVSKVAESRRAWWIELQSSLSLRLAKESLPEFAGLDPQDLQGRQLTVRGWVSYRGPSRRGYPEHVMALQHPAMIEAF